MSRSNRCRRLSVVPLAGVERQGRGALGSGSLAVGISHSLPSGFRFIQGTHPFSGVLSQFDQGQSSGGRGPVFAGQGSDRACSSSLSGLLQPVICSDESLRCVEAGHRSIYPESEDSADILQDGDSSICPSVGTPGRLDGVSGLEGCVLAGSDTSGVSQVPQVHGGRDGVPVQGSLLWPLHRTSGFHQGHGSCVSYSSQDGGAASPLPRRLVTPGFLSRAGSPCSEDSAPALQVFGDSRQLGEVSDDSVSADGLSGGHSGLNLFQGFSCPEESREASLNWRRILVLRQAASVILAGAIRSAVLADPARSGRSSLHEISPACSAEAVGPCRPIDSGQVVSGDSPGSRLVARSRSVGARHFSGAGVPSARIVVRRLGRGLGGSSGRKCYFRPLGSRGSRVFHQCQRAPGHRESSPVVCSASCRFFGGNLRRQFHVGTHSLLLNSIAQRILRWAENLLVVISPQFIMGKHNVLADSLSRPNQILGSEWTLKREVFQDLCRRWPVSIDLLQHHEITDVRYIFLLTTITTLWERMLFFRAGMGGRLMPFLLGL